MHTFDALLRSLAKLWRGVPSSPFDARPLPPISYPRLSIVTTPPRNDEIAPGLVTVVASRSRPKWAMLLCPCGCQSVITLPLQATKRPHWTCKRGRAGRPTLQPSIWRDVGCLSHFFLKDGRIFWCDDTGISPRKIREAAFGLRRG